MAVTVEIEIPPYLKQWIIEATGGEHPVSFPKGSPYTSFLRVFLRPKRENTEWHPSKAEALQIKIPSFPGKDPAIHNHLTEKARRQLCELIRDNFDVALYTDMSRFEKASRKKRHNELLLLWMEENGIEPTDTNFCAVVKRLQILRRRAFDRYRKKLSYRKQKS